jgi:hypothetical protein
MDLEGQFLGSIEQFQQQWETRTLGEITPENLGTVFYPELVQGFPAPRALADDALCFLAIDDFPRLPNPSARRQLLAVNAFEPAASPDSFHENGFENEWLHRGNLG